MIFLPQAKAYTSSMRSERSSLIVHWQKQRQTSPRCKAQYVTVYTLSKRSLAKAMALLQQRRSPKARAFSPNPLCSGCLEAGTLRSSFVTLSLRRLLPSGKNSGRHSSLCATLSRMKTAQSSEEFGLMRCLWDLMLRQVVSS
jgi:hypothetical protein